MDTITTPETEAQAQPRGIRRVRVALAGTVALIAATLCGLLAPVAANAATSTAVTDVNTAAGNLKDQLLQIGGDVLPYAAVVVALTIGWRFARKFVKG